MQAVTDFEATRGLIEYAVSIFRMRLDEKKNIEARDRENWIAEKVKRDWFKRPEAYWNRYASGDIGDTFERYEMFYKFRPVNYDWYAGRLEYAENLLKRFNCAAGECQAKEIVLSDEDLALLSISLQSALEN
jgi:hypothetical protein